MANLACPWRSLAAFVLACVALAPITAVAQTTSPCTLGMTPVVLQPTLPPKPNTFLALAKSQPGADCLAWQEFIALNWRANPGQPGYPDKSASAASFGTPGDTSAKVWESYSDASVVFAQRSGTAQTFAALPRPPIKRLRMVSKFGDAIVKLNGVIQATGQWLTDQRGNLTYYEVRLNQDEYEFVTKNVFSGADLTTFAGQFACATQPGKNGLGGFNLPAGSGQDVDCRGNPARYGQDVGAIEIKASWVILPSDHSLDYRYETSQAQVTDPFGKTTTATVGLVGLHIIHKMPGAPQFVWATFEQIDNDPDQGGTGPALPANPKQKPRPGFTYFNPSCSPAKDPYYKCQPNTAPLTPCKQGSTTIPAGCDPYSAPVQVTRVYPVETVANTMTGYAWSLLPAASVFNYYRLIDAQWPNSPSPIAPGSTVPLTPGDITPADQTRIVANSASETYVQTSNSCMDCHKHGGIAQKSIQSTMLVGGLEKRRVLVGDVAGAAPQQKSYASDYSFVFATETVH